MASENGWEPLHPSASQLEWVTVPGTNPPVRLQFLKGQPLLILRAFAADFNAYVELLRDADSAAYTATNSVATSNHLNGTAMDLNWNSHRFHISYDGFDAAKIATMRELLSWYEDTVWWGQDWKSPIDCMHLNMGYDTYGSENVARVQSFIDRKIRSDGFSTFRRGGVVTPPPLSDQVDILARATGVSAAKAQDILVGVVNGLRDSQCNNVNRVAMWLAQMGHESGSFVYTEEIASGAAYEGRADLGNTQPGDGVRFKGRSWIQITGRSNYTKLSKWAFDQGIVPSPTFFVDDSSRLAQIQYAGLGPAWYWVVARPQINALSDARNLTAVTQAINGGQNGATDRKNRYDRALALGDQLLALISGTPTQGEDMAAVPQDQWDRVYRELTQRLPSRSPLRHLGEGVVDTMAGFILNVDGSQHVEIVHRLASYGDPDALALLREVAGADPNKYPDRQHDSQLAQAMLAEVTAKPAAFASNTEVYGTVQKEQTPQVVYLPAPEAPAPVSGESTGAIIGRAYDALEALQLSGALTDTEKAPLAALIGVLQTKTQGAA